MPFILFCGKVFLVSCFLKGSMWKRVYHHLFVKTGLIIAITNQSIGL